jgi:hypothetical protein
MRRTGRRHDLPRLWAAPRSWQGQNHDLQSVCGPALQLIVQVWIARLGKRVLASPQGYERGMWDHERPPVVPVEGERC